MNEEEKRELARLRVHIEDVTKSIIDLISARQKLSIEVARDKRKSAAPIENLKVESSLATKMEDYAEQLGVDPVLATRILSLILDSSKTVQRRAYYEESIRSFLKEKGIRKIAVIGAGRMGGLVRVILCRSFTFSHHLRSEPGEIKEACQ